MLTLAPRKLLHLIKKKISPREKRSQEAIYVSSEIRNSEFEIRNEKNEEIRNSELEIRNEKSGEIRNSELEIRNEKGGEIRNSEFEIRNEKGGEIQSEAVASESISDTKSHLTSSVPRAASVPRGAMTKQELNEARALFRGLDDGEIHRLYKKVTQ